MWAVFAVSYDPLCIIEGSWQTFEKKENWKILTFFEIFKEKTWISTYFSVQRVYKLYFSERVLQKEYRGRKNNQVKACRAVYSTLSNFWPPQGSGGYILSIFSKTDHMRKVHPHFSDSAHISAHKSTIKFSVHILHTKSVPGTALSVDAEKLTI